MFNWERDRYPGERPIRWGPIVLGMAAVGALAFAVSRVAEPGPSGFPPMTQGMETPDPSLRPETTSLAAADPTPPARSDSTRPRADTTRPADRPSTAPPLAAAPPSQARRLPELRPPNDAQTRWTSTWVNVRERPSNQSAVVRVLNPGERVEVENPNRSWSLIYVGGRPLGYLSVALLVNEPPG